MSVAGEAAQWVDPAEIPSDGDVAKLGQALAAGMHGDRDELMATTAAYGGLRWGELIALTVAQVDQAARAITVDRKVVEVAGHLFLEAPKNRKQRKTSYPRLTPAGYPLAERLATRIEQARAEREAGTNPLGCSFHRPKRHQGDDQGRITSGQTVLAHRQPRADHQDEEHGTAGSGFGVSRALAYGSAEGGRGRAGLVTAEN